MYLTTDIIGAASGIVYGKKGDQVNVIAKDHDMTTVEFGGHIFHVKNGKLSKAKIDKDIEQIKITAKKKK